MLYLDTSALLARHINVAPRTLVNQHMLNDRVWVTSAIALTEGLVMIDKLTDLPLIRSELEDAFRLDWDRCHVVPVDQRCLDSAAQMARDQLLRLADSIHLAAADRLPRPVSFLTFDPAQIPVAIALGLDVVSA